MASTDRIFVSPGVFTSEKDLTFVTRQVGVTTLGLLGETPKGPAFEPVFISNYDEFVSYFGGLNSEKFKENGFQKYELNYIAKSFLTQTNQLYVSRVLGLSGYDAGNAWSITLDAAHDPSTEIITNTDPAAGILTYSATSAGTPLTMTFDDPLLQALYDGGEISSSFSSIGLLNTGQTISISSPAYIKDETACTFSGATFDLEITETGSGSTVDFVTGTTSGTVVTYTASCYSDIDGSVIATLRSRGSYNSDEELIYDVTGATDVVMANTTSLPTDPLASFSISGTSSNGTSIDYDVSMDKTSKNYLTKVFGSSTQDKETELFVEEIYGNVLEDLITSEKVRGLDTTFVSISADSANNLNDYKEKWLSAYSPWVLSELKGTGAGSTLQRLFRFITISDGNAANKDIKFSIINIKPDNRTFDLVIRNFNDTDDNPSVVEKFSNLSMDSTSNGYIARKIGTNDGEYPLRSKYIMVELYDENDPDLKNHFPAGFEGVLNRTYIGDRTAIAPKIEYQTTYDEFTTSKLRKTYLGLNSTIGVDQDFFNYKGINNVDAGVTDSNRKNTYSGRTDGFHLDVNATSATIDAGEDTYVPTLQVGVSAFTTDSGLSGGPYDKLAARKFTFAPFGGYDGWDEYRTQRTNGDSYTKTGSKGSLGLTSGLFSSYVTSEGDDGITSDYYAFLDGIYTYNNPEAVNINVFASPGLDLENQIGLVESAVDMVEVDRADSLYVITTPDVDSDNEPRTVGEAVDLVEDSGVDSNYSATYWPWLQMNDTENNKYVWLPPTVEVMRNIALTDNVAFPWFAAAGLNRGTTNAVKARVKLRLDDRDTLYEGRLNPMATFSDVGVVIFGNKTLQVKETALNRINVRRLLLQARKLISAVSIRLLFEQNDEVVRNQFLSLVNPILDNIRKERGLTDFRVTLDDTPESIDRNELNGRVFIKPTRSLEYISIEFNITNTGANFDDI
tara:strand:+ start:4311 stop:7190 length:2880 start_codon:yes stop_codon:yes gene_type:complete